MPLLKIDKIGSESAWALWSITESEQELASAAMEPTPEKILSKHKRLEFLSGRALIKMLVEHSGLDYQGLRKDEYGKPFLKGHDHFISLSHSFPYVAAQIHTTLPVGIDLEQPKDKLLKIAPRVLSAVELADAGDDIVKHCIYWCAKEAMYKIDGRRGWHFQNQLHVVPFDFQRQGGNLKGRIIMGDTVKEVLFAYIVQADYVVVYTNFEKV